MLDHGCIQEWLRENCLPVRRLAYVPNPANLSEEAFEKWIPVFVDGVFSCEYVEEYRMKGKVSKVTLRLTFRPDAVWDEIIDKIRAFAYTNIN